MTKCKVKKYDIVFQSSHSATKSSLVHGMVGLACPGFGLSNVTAMDSWLSLFSCIGFFAIQVARSEGQGLREMYSLPFIRLKLSGLSLLLQ